MSSKKCGAACCHVGNSSVSQTIAEMDFERGIWGAASNGDIKRLNEILQKDRICVSAPDPYGYTALHFAARNGYLPMCRLLIEKGADVNALTHGKASPLHRAAHQGHSEIVKLLLQHGADPFLQDSDGKTALHKAAEQYHLNVAQLLVQKDEKLKLQQDQNKKFPKNYVDEKKCRELYSLLYFSDDCLH